MGWVVDLTYWYDSSRGLHFTCSPSLHSSTLLCLYLWKRLIYCVHPDNLKSF